MAKAIYLHHERETSTDLENDLLVREIGIDPEAKVLCALSEYQALVFHAMCRETVAPGFDVLIGTGTRLVTSTAAGNLGNATTIAGNYTLSGTLAVGSTLTVSSTTTILGAGIQLDNGQGIATKNSGGTYRQIMALQSDNTLDIGGTVDGGLRFFTAAGNSAGIVTGSQNWVLGAGAGLKGTRMETIGGADATAGILVTTSVTNADGKDGRIKVAHYLNAEEPVTMIRGTSGSSTNVIDIGGGNGAENAATAIDFYTAATYNVLTGTRRGGFSSSGVFDVVGNATIGGTLVVTGLLTATAGILINGGSFAAGKIYHGSTDGLVVAGKTGSNYDFSLVNNAGTQYLLRNPTGTNNLEFPNAVSLGSTLGVTGATTLAALSATTGAFSSNVTVGGTLVVTGALTAPSLVLSSDSGIARSVSTGYTLVGGSNTVTEGAELFLFGKTHATKPSDWRINRDGSMQLEGVSGLVRVSTSFALSSKLTRSTTWSIDSGLPTSVSVAGYTRIRYTYDVGVGNSSWITLTDGVDGQIINIVNATPRFLYISNFESITGSTNMSIDAQRSQTLMYDATELAWLPLGSWSE